MWWISCFRQHLNKLVVTYEKKNLLIWITTRCTEKRAIFVFFDWSNTPRYPCTEDASIRLVSWKSMTLNLRTETLGNLNVEYPTEHLCYWSKQRSINSFKKHCLVKLKIQNLCIQVKAYNQITISFVNCFVIDSQLTALIILVASKSRFEGANFLLT